MVCMRACARARVCVCVCVCVCVGKGVLYVKAPINHTTSKVHVLSYVLLKI